jgi:hypothetical protein
MFADMQGAVSEVLDHLEDYRGELRALMTETFHILDKQDIPVHGIPHEKWTGG